MVVLKKIDKKAQSGGWGTLELVAMILVIAVAILLGVGFYFGWDSLFGKIGLAPNTLEAAGKLCVATAGMTPADSCTNFKTMAISDKKQKASCDYLRSANLYPGIKELDCSSFNIAKSANETCVNGKLKADYLVNGKPCSEWKITAEAGFKTCSALGGKWQTGSCATGKQFTVDEISIIDPRDSAKGTSTDCCKI